MKFQDTLVITPTHEECESKAPSCYVSTGHSCPVCGGSGGWRDYDQVELPWKECRICKGSGLVRARVIVEWEADTEPDAEKTEGTVTHQRPCRWWEIEEIRKKYGRKKQQ
jgi:DnaJ-class molecular chaperone